MDRPQIYLTKEQLHRLSGLACDALVGIQLESTTDAETPVTGCFVTVDDPRTQSFFWIDADGTYRDYT